MSLWYRGTLLPNPIHVWFGQYRHIFARNSSTIWWTVHECQAVRMTEATKLGESRALMINGNELWCVTQEDDGITRCCSWGCVSPEFNLYLDCVEEVSLRSEVLIPKSRAAQRMKCKALDLSSERNCLEWWYHMSALMLISSEELSHFGCWRHPPHSCEKHAEPGNENHENRASMSNCRPPHAFGLSCPRIFLPFALAKDAW